MARLRLCLLRFVARRTLAVAALGTVLLLLGAVIGSRLVFAVTPPPDPAQLALIEEGFRVFTTETFGGNGRTCSTCHLPEKNYNISPADIAEMTPAQKALVLATGNPDLENPTLVEKLALFNINEGHASGTGTNPAGPFRGSMTVAGLAHTTLNNHCSVPADLAAQIPALVGPCVTQAVPEVVNDGINVQMLGWAGNGGANFAHPDDFGTDPAGQDCRDAVNAFQASPADLTKALRAFALGAVKTHNTIRMDRVPGTDFRCPTSGELDALAAFQLWLGRRFELDLTQITFTKGPSSPWLPGPGRVEGPGPAEVGKALFMSDVATCHRCHFNAGANGSLGRVLQPDFGADDPGPPPPNPTVPGSNKASHTSTDILRIREAPGSPLNDGLNLLTAPVVIPRDAGDGQLRGGNQADGLRAGGFNMQSLIEAPRKKAFFHNNGFADKVEDAVAFYFTDTFDRSQGGGGRVRAIRFCAVPGNFCPNTPDQLLSGPDALAALGGAEAVNKIGFFLRSLSAVYSLADCERLVQEMIDRIGLGLSTDLPGQHCRFALDDVRHVFEGAQVSPMPYQGVPDYLSSIEARLTDVMSKPAGGEAETTVLETVVVDLQKIRNSIATTPQLP